MKRKNGFVTNSSSTSFILVDKRINKSEPLKVKVELEIEVLYSLDSQKIDEENLQEEIRYMSEEDKQRMREFFEKNKEHKIYKIRVSNDSGDMLENALYRSILEEEMEIKLPENVEIIATGELP